MHFLTKFCYFYTFVVKVEDFFRNFTNDDINRLYTLTDVLKRYTETRHTSFTWKAWKSFYPSISKVNLKIVKKVKLSCLVLFIVSVQVSVVSCWTNIDLRSPRTWRTLSSRRSRCSSSSVGPWRTNVTLLSFASWFTFLDQKLRQNTFKIISIQRISQQTNRAKITFS